MSALVFAILFVLLFVVFFSMTSRVWLLKSEPHEFSIYQLESQLRGRWDGVRNYGARNYIRAMNIGDLAYFYHSNCPAPGIYGKMRISSQSYPDPTAVDEKSKYFDKKSKDESKARWSCIDVEHVRTFKVPILLPEIKAIADFGPSPLVAKGNRLSVIPIEESQYLLLEKLISEKESEKNSSK